MKSIYLFLSSLFLVCISAHAETVNINKADAAMIAQHLSGIGPVKAQAIVDYRTEHGEFESLEALTKVPGVGASIVEANKDKLSIQDKPGKVSLSPSNHDKEVMSNDGVIHYVGVP